MRFIAALPILLLTGCPNTKPATVIPDGAITAIVTRVLDGDTVAIQIDVKNKSSD